MTFRPMGGHATTISFALVGLAMVVAAPFVSCSSAEVISGGDGGASGSQGGGGNSGSGNSTSPKGGGGGGFVIPDALVAADRPSGGNCGDGIIERNESCDDGNNESGDGCSKLCQVENNWRCPEQGKPCENLAKCGNGYLTSDETCDDGNTNDGDGCSKDCKKIETGWQCRVPGKACTPSCGDKVISGWETCDDGNTKSGDLCSQFCTKEIIIY